MDFLGPHFGGVPGGVAQNNFGRKNCICSSTTLHKNSISMCCGLGEERTKFRKKKKKKKEKKRKKKEKKEKKGKKKETKEINFIAAKSGLVGMKGYLDTYNPMKYFLPYLSRF